jgi:hypothetical protein
MNSESGNAVICNLIRAVQELTKSADRKLIRSNTDWTPHFLLLLHQAALPDKTAKKHTPNIPRNLIFSKKIFWSDNAAHYIFG